MARRKGKQSFRLTSRCQVVKLSESTQTAHLVHLEVQSGNQEPLRTSADQKPATAVTRRPTGGQTSHCLPSGCLPFIKPLQPQTSLVYLLTPSSQAPSPHPMTPPYGLAHLLTPSSTLKHCRKERRPRDLHGLKIGYKHFPVRFYDPHRHCVLKLPLSSGPAPYCTRQLFRCLRPDPNAYRMQVKNLLKVNGQKSPDILQSTLSRTLRLANSAGQSGATKDLPTRSHTLRLRPLAAKRCMKIYTLPSQAPAVREGLRQTVSKEWSFTSPSLWGHVLRGQKRKKEKKTKTS